MEQSWLKFYHAAVLETDWSKLEGRILAAEARDEKGGCTNFHEPWRNA